MGYVRESSQRLSLFRGGYARIEKGDDLIENIGRCYLTRQGFSRVTPMSGSRGMILIIGKLKGE